MKLAEKYVREEMKDTHDVLGGYISPCHPSYIFQKLGTTMCLPGSTRNHLIDLGVQDDPTWMLDPYMSSTKKFVDNTLVLKAFSQRLNCDDKDIFWVMGTDNFWGGMVEDALSQVPNMQCIVVENRDAESAKVFRDRVQARGVKGVH